MGGGLVVEFFQVLKAKFTSKTLGLLIRKIVSTSLPMKQKALCSQEEVQGNGCDKYPTCRLTLHRDVV